MAATWYSVFGTQEVKVVKETDSIYNQTNPYGFIFNVNHPAVAAAMAEFRQEIGETVFPLSDADRFEFEKRIATGHYPQIEKYLPR